MYAYIHTYVLCMCVKMLWIKQMHFTLLLPPFTVAVVPSGRCCCCCFNKRLYLLLLPLMHRYKTFISNRNKPNVAESVLIRSWVQYSAAKCVKLLWITDVQVHVVLLHRMCVYTLRIHTIKNLPCILYDMTNGCVCTPPKLARLL